MDERPHLERRPRVPPAVLTLFVGLLIVQITSAAFRPPPRPQLADLPEAPPAAVLQALALGEPEALSALIVLRLQSFDDQPGASASFAALDYRRLAAWLERALDIDPRGDYPLLLAAQVYAQVPDAARQRIMLDFVHRAFLADPGRRWRWLAHAAIMARHRLHDDALALRYARDLAAYAPAAPGWARQMHVLLLEDLGELQQAKILLGALLASGAVTDAAEARFLSERLDRLEREGGRARSAPR